MPIVNFAGGGKGKTANKGSCADLMAYLLHEQEERRGAGVVQLFDAQSCLFDATVDQLALDAAIQKIDYNKKGLKKDEAKFYYADIDFSEEELVSIFEGFETDADKEDAIRRFVRDTFIPLYAANFDGYKDKSGNAIKFKADDIVWAAAIHSRRLDRFGKIKEGPGWHAHVVMSRRNLGMTRSLSPTRNQRKENKGSCQGGFDRNEFRRKIEMAIEEKYSYRRPIEDTISTRVEMAHISVDDLQSQVNALMMHGLQLQIEAEERRKAKVKAAQEAAAKKKAEEEARAQAAKEKAAREAAEAKRKAEELAKAEVEKAAAKKAVKTRKPRLSAEEKETMRKRPIEKAHRAWSNQCTDRDRDRAVFVQNENRGEKIFRTFGHQATLTAQHANVPVEEFIHSSGKMIKFVALSLEKLREVVGEFVKKKIPYHFVDEWGLWLSDDETRKVLEPEKKEKTQIPAQRPRVEKTQSAPTPTTTPPAERKPKTMEADAPSTASRQTTPTKKSVGEVAFDVWQREHKKDDAGQSRIVFVLRNGAKGDFYQTFKQDAYLAAWTKEHRQPKPIDNGPMKGVEFFNVDAKNIRWIFRDLRNKGIECAIIDTNGKYLSLPPEPTKQRQKTSPAVDIPTPGITPRVWSYQGKWFMNAVVHGLSIPVREIRIEDAKAFKLGNLKADHLISKYYSPDELKPKENISKGRGPKL